MNPSTDSLLYALVARGTDVLAEYIMPGISGNFSQVTRVLLSRIDLSQERATYELDGYLFHYFISKNITYLCMGDQAFGNFAPFEFLDDIRVRFSTTYGASASTAIAYSLNSEFSNVLQARMKFFNKARVNNSKIAAVQHELSLARNVMVENIDRVLERGDRIELLVDKSEQLDASALQFRKRATKLKRSMWCKNVKTISLMIVVVLAILYIILSLSCGGPSLSHLFWIFTIHCDVERFLEHGLLLIGSSILYWAHSTPKVNPMSQLADVGFSYKPNRKNELVLNIGDVVQVDHQGPDGWGFGKIQNSNQRPGFFPLKSVVMRGPSDQPLQSMGFEKFIDPEIVAASSEIQISSTRYGMWATNMTIGSAISLIGSSTVIFYWLFSNAILYSTWDLVICLYGIVAGAGIALYESRWKERSPTNFPKRAVTYTILAIPTLMSIITLTAGATLLISAFVHLVSAVKSEKLVQDAKPKHSRPRVKAKKEIWRRLSLLLKEENKLGEVVWMAIWTVFNITLFVTVLLTWFEQIDAMPTNFAASQFVAWAKAWGAILDLNCALVFLPVCRTFIRYLYDLSTQSQTSSQRFLRRILAFIPLDKALEFHKIVAWVILFSAVMHTLMHLVNYGLSPDYTWQFYGIWPWTTGVALFICMLFLYAAAPHNVKWAHFEIFWYSHHFFIGFIILLFPHGRGGINRNIWKSLVIVVPIYLLERLYRTLSAYRCVSLTSITNMGNVIALSFDRKTAFPAGYKEGQYLYLNVPHISKGEWHPFTISSAPQEEDVTVHIRVIGAEKGTSWTARLADYCSVLMPTDTAFHSFVNPNDKSGARGKVIGPDGLKLFRVYGPHSAPTQHVSEYSIVMVIGAGIGITPICATVKSIVHYRWKFSIGRSYPDHAYFYFVTSHKEVDSFRWVIRLLKEADDEVHNLWAVNPENSRQKTFKFHIFVTSVPDNCNPAVLNKAVGNKKFWGSSLHGDENLVLVKAPWTETEMLMSMQCPQPGPPRQFGNIMVHRGRPKWSEQFQHVASTHAANDIGVAYCGNPIIASDLLEECIRYSSTTSKTFFRLHKENF